MFALALALVHRSDAAADIEFKSSSPVSIYVDGRQASQPNPLRHKVNALDPGVHQLKVVGMFGKTLYEAEIDLPDNTITYASWERGEIKVLSTDWLPKGDEETVAAENDTGTDEEELQLVEVPPPPPVEPPIPDAVAAIDPAPAAAAATTAAVAAEVAAGVAIDEPTPPPPVAPAAAPPSRTLTLTAADGMRIEIVHGGQTIAVVVDGNTFRIEDGSGLSLALSGALSTEPNATGTASED